MPRFAFIPVLLCCIAAGLAAVPASLFETRSPRGLDFVLQNSPTAQRYLIETMPGGVALFDYNNDGLLDIFLVNGGRVTSPMRLPENFDRKNPRYWNRLYRQNKDGSFSDVTEKAGLANAGDGNYGMGVAVGDYDNDGFPDLYVTSYGNNVLYHNNGDGTFTDVTAKAGVAAGGWSVSAGFFDYDNDGKLDLFVTRYMEWDTKHSKTCGGEWHTYCPPEEFPATTSILYHNNGDGTFSDISAAGGSGITTTASSRGIAVGDLWNDGRISAVINNMNAVPSLLVNQIRNPNHWIAIHTIGTKSNRDGIGARIRVKTAARTLVDEVRSGSSYISNSDMRVHFGLGKSDKVDWVEIRWPSGLTERFANLPVDQIHTLKEGSGATIEPEAKKPT
jgi:enediyne biosynthesis protein E4